MAYSPSPRDELRMLTNNVRAYLEALGVWGVQHIPIDQPPARTSPDPKVDAGSPPTGAIPTSQRYR